MKIAVILGTRPEIIKLAPIVRELERKKASFFLLHTGQHYSYSLDRVFFEQLNLRPPEINLDTGSGSHAEVTARMLVSIEKVLLERKPDIIIIEGDTNSVLAGALAASKLGIRIAHVEAGLRSYDRGMPEEINRVLTDHLSDYLFAPTPAAARILAGEGIPPETVFVTGNTIVDSVRENSDLVENGADYLEELGLQAGEYCLATIHRQENVDRRERFAAILEGLEMVSAALGVPVFYPVHPRAKKMMGEFGLHPDKLILAEPVDYLGFLYLEKQARLILTDSGGIQEEACILQVPCVTLRDNTERPETVAVGANIIAGTSSPDILRCAREMLARDRQWENPFGDGTAARKIVEILEGAL